MIDIEFYGKMIPFIRTRYQTRAEQAVTHAWKIYNSHLNKLADYQSPDGWMRTQELLSDLLYELSSALGYDLIRFSYSEIAIDLWHISSMTIYRKIYS